MALLEPLLLEDTTGAVIYGWEIETFESANIGFATPRDPGLVRHHRSGQNGQNGQNGYTGHSDPAPFRRRTRSRYLQRWSMRAAASRFSSWDRFGQRSELINDRLLAYCQAREINFFRSTLRKSHGRHTWRRRTCSGTFVGYQPGTGITFATEATNYPSRSFRGEATVSRVAWASAS